ncbi:MAG: glycerophosphodiester phosphodiesterase family protein [Bacteroidaceae bacterium]|nr:glycerophosphodiester phosphodiesterase family protein [Bacteroidaceae bacterium]
MIEIDVRRTKDGHYVLMHNATIDQMTNGSGSIDSLTLKDLRRYRLRGPDGKLTHERIPMLQEVFRAAKGKILLNIDKGYSYYPEICDLAARMGVLQEINFKLPDHVSEAHAIRDGLTARVECMPVIVMDRNDAAESVAYYLERGVGAIECVMSQITPRVAELLCQIEARGCRILVGTMWPQVSGGYTDEKAIREGADASWGVLLRHGTTVFQTDHPQEMLDYLNGYGYRGAINKNPGLRLAISK